MTYDAKARRLAYDTDGAAGVGGNPVTVDASGYVKKTIGPGPGIPAGQTPRPVATRAVLTLYPAPLDSREGERVVLVVNARPALRAVRRFAKGVS